MVNFICIKWGDKYSSEWVNRLYRMVSANFKNDFEFICLTDDTKGIAPLIETEELPDYDLETWWWKLTLFEEKTDDINIFIDLDVAIQNDITHWLDLVQKDKLCTIKAYWKEKILENEPERDHDLNSSVMIWTGDLRDIWSNFIENKDFYTTTYRGIDSYLYYHKLDYINWIPRNEIYSRLYGIDKNRYWNPKNNPGSANTILDNLFYDESYNMCIFNGYKRVQLNSDTAAKRSGEGPRYMDNKDIDIFNKYFNA
jgi:hypothetical protein